MNLYTLALVSSAVGFAAGWYIGAVIRRRMRAATDQELGLKR